jgi:hypothetical protein
MRNGVDVAGSLRIMEQRDIRRRQIRSRRLISVLKGKSELERHGFRGAVRHLYLDGGFSLWEEYVAQAEGVLAEIEQSKFVLRYEDFLSDPARYLSDLYRFCELGKATATHLDAVASQIQRDRAYAFSNDAELTEFFASVKQTPWMVRLGYSYVPTRALRQSCTQLRAHE